MRSKLWSLMALAAIFALVLIACAPLAAPVVQPTAVAPANAPTGGAAQPTAAAAQPTAVGPTTAGAATDNLSSADRAVQEAKKYAGTTLNVTWEAALQSQDPLLFSGPKWEQLTGIKINVVQLQFPDLYSKAIAEHIAGSGAYDVLSINGSWLPDFADGGLIEQLDPYIAKYMNQAELQDINPRFIPFMKWDDKTWALYDDGDVFIMYYRKDWFDDKQNQADFKAKFNRDLTPPKTWGEWDEVCSFFTDKFKAQGNYGCALQRAEGQVYEWFYDHFRVNGGKFFDDNMKATINSEAGVKTLQEMVAENKNMPPGVEKWDFLAVLSAWLSGKAGMIITWPPIGRWSEGYGTQTEQLSWVPKTTVAGKVGYAIPPGGHSELAGGFDLAVSSDSKNKEAAYLFIQWMQSKDISIQRVELPYALRDPYRLSHYSDPSYQALWPTAKDYLNTLKGAGDAGLADMAIYSVREYDDAADKAITAAMGGADPKASLDQAAQQWDAITQRIGVDKQKKAYQIWLQNEGQNAYPAP